MRVVDAIVRPGDVVLDIGAAWGLYASRLAQLVGRTGSVHVFEPNPVYQAPLEALARRLPQLVLHNVALSDHSGEAMLHVPTIGTKMIEEMATLRPAESRGWEVGARRRVPVCRLDDLAMPDRVSFVKCDVEGQELEVVEGATKLLDGRPIILMEIEQRHHDDPIEQVFERLEALGYDLFAVRPEGLTALADFDVEADQAVHLRRKASPESSEPADYVKDFVLCPKGTRTLEKLLAG